ncbi:MAG TPA: hypothetical protein VGM56_21650 [Byssovorax sp.]
MNLAPSAWPPCPRAWLERGTPLPSPLPMPPPAVPDLARRDVEPVTRARRSPPAGHIERASARDVVAATNPMAVLVLSALLVACAVLLVATLTVFATP